MRRTQKSNSAEGRPESSRAPASARPNAAQTDPRRRALAVLDAVERGGAADELFERAFEDATLAGRDRAFARNLVATTLRRRGQIDAAIGVCLERPLSGKVLAALNVLRIGACQLLFLETPPHAAVDSAVRLCEAGATRPYKALVNAVLRRLAREREAVLSRHDEARLNTPEWLWRSWSAAYGEDACRQIAVAHLSEPPLDLTVKSDPAAWAERLGGGVLPTGSVRIWPRGPVADLDGFAEGAWWVQDAAATLPARLLGDVAGRRVIDLCAAPGGKTAQLAAAGARVVAVDRSEARLGRLRRNLDRLGLSAEIVVADAATWTPAEPADAVLLDAPCTATGTIRRHPDIAWTKTPENVAALANEQDRLLAAAARMTRPGGTLVYCVCSLQPEEGPERAAHAAAAGLIPSPIVAGEVAGAEGFVTAAGHLRTLPHQFGRDGGIDGFFAARFTRGTF